MIGTQLKDFPEGFHELLQRSEGQETYVTLRDWILKHPQGPGARL